MKKNRTDLIILVDRSGSMINIASDMIGGYNTFIKKQKELPNECVVSFYQFDDVYETVFERVKLQDVPELTDKTYIPRNSTALNDALGRTIDEYGMYLASLPEDERPERVMVITITDGYENASSIFKLDQIREKIKTQTEVYKWDFVFMGSNIDAWDAGNSLGISAKATLQFASSPGAVKASFASLADNTTAYRCAAVHEQYSFSVDDLTEQTKFLDPSLKTKNEAMINKLGGKTNK